MSFQLAVDRKEAIELASEGYGYPTKKAAVEALATSNADHLYRSKLKVFEVKP